jgi:hypothetical protein
MEVESLLQMMTMIQPLNNYYFYMHHTDSDCWYYHSQLLGSLVGHRHLSRLLNFHLWICCTLQMQMLVEERELEERCRKRLLYQALGVALAVVDWH